MTDRREILRDVIVFLVLTWLFSSVFYFLILSGGKLGSAGGNYVFSLMWCPAFAALATCRIRKKNLSELGWRWPDARYAALSYGIPLLYALIAYGVVWITGLAKFFNADFVKSMDWSAAACEPQSLCPERV